MRISYKSLSIVASRCFFHDNDKACVCLFLNLNDKQSLSLSRYRKIKKKRNSDFIKILSEINNSPIEHVIKWNKIMSI
jgi:hypothetical protein